MKPQSFFISLVVIFSLFVFPASSYAQNEDTATDSAEVVDVYSVFWPIVPGKTVADSMFWAKQLKEQIGGFFTFGDINKSEYEISLAEKRLVEAHKLLKDDKDYPNAKKTLEMNKVNRDKALEYMKKAQEANRKVNELKGRLVTSLENQQLVLENLVTQVPEDQKGSLEEIVKELTLQISEAR